MEKKRLVILLLVLSLCFPTLIFAETIVLKSGKTVEGKIIEKTDKYVKIDSEGVPLTYYYDEIEKIEGAQVTVAELPAPQALPENPEGRFVNEEYGFEIMGPRGWFMHLGQGGKQTAAYFTKQSEEKFILPVLGVTIDMAPPNIQTALDFTNFVLPGYQGPAKRDQGVFNLIESPHEIEINGLKGSRFIFEMLARNNKGIKSIDCKFMRGNLIVSLQGMDYPETFNTHLKDFEQAINTFKFTVPEDDFIELKKLNEIQADFKPIESDVSWEALKKPILENIQAKDSFKSLFILKDETESKLANNDFKGMEWVMMFGSPQSFEITQSDYYSNVGDIWRVVGDEIYMKIGVWMPMPTPVDNPEVNQMIKARREIYKILSFDKYLDLLRKELPTGIMENVQDRYVVIQFKPSQIEDLFTGRPQEGSFKVGILVWVDNKDKTIKFVKTNIEGKDKDGKELKKEHEHYFSNYNFPFKLSKPEMAWMQMQEKKQ